MQIKFAHHDFSKFANFADFIKSTQQTDPIRNKTCVNFIKLGVTDCEYYEFTDREVYAVLFEVPPTFECGEITFLIRIFNIYCDSSSPGQISWRVLYTDLINPENDNRTSFTTKDYAEFYFSKLRNGDLFNLGYVELLKASKPHKLPYHAINLA
jgi:hypothetical protein